MKRFSKAELVELAFVLSNGEELASDQAEAAQSLQESEYDLREVGEYRRVLGLVREALAAAPPPEAACVGPCLDDDTVAAYVDDALVPRARVAAEVHFAQCPSCLEQLSELAGLVREAPASYEPRSILTYVLEIARQGIRLLSHPEGGFSLLEPAPVAVLGSESKCSEAQKCCTWRQYFGVYSVLISVVQANEERVDVSLAVSRDSEPVPKARITLRRDDHIVQSESTPESGRVCLLSLETGVYECEVRLPNGRLKRHFELDFRECSL